MISLTPEFTRVVISSADPDIEMSQDLIQEIRQALDEVDQDLHEKLHDGGPPQVLLNTETHDVWVSAGDWHESEVVDAIFEKLEQVDGINELDGESESYPEGFSYDGGPWEEVWPDAPSWARTKEGSIL